MNMVTNLGGITFNITGWPWQTIPHFSPVLLQFCLYVDLKVEWPNIYMLTTLAFENFLQGESWENCLVSKSIGWCAFYQSLLKRDEWNILRNTVVINKKKNVYRVIHSVAILSNSHIWHPAVTSLYVLITIWFFFYRYVIRVWKQYFARR